jgi:myo-inositol catabolism protein IolC
MSESITVPSLPIWQIAKIGIVLWPARQVEGSVSRPLYERSGSGLLHWSLEEIYCTLVHFGELWLTSMKCYEDLNLSHMQVFLHV